METKEKTLITVEATINAPVEKVWECWMNPQHIVKWNHASDDWHSPHATNDPREGGRFTARMEAKDGSMGFDFGGTYTEVVSNKKITYTMDDERRVSILFTSSGNQTRVTESFEAESTHSLEMQQGGWQAILNNFKQYTESHAN